MWEKEENLSECRSVIKVWIFIFVPIHLEETTTIFVRYVLVLSHRQNIILLYLGTGKKLLLYITAVFTSVDG